MSTITRGARVGRSVRAHRQRQGISLRDLAARLEVSPATLSGIENGNTALSVDRLFHIADELDVSAPRLLEPGDVGDLPRPPATAQGLASWPDLPDSDAGDWRTFHELPLDPALTGALIAFCEKGFHGASIRDIADCAGLSVAGLYHYHRSKQSMLPALLDLTMADLFWRLEAARDGEPDADERLHRTVECLALYHARRPRLAFLGASEMRSLAPSDRSRITRYRKDVQRMLDDDIRAALREDPDADRLVVTLGNSISTMCTSIAQWIHHDGSISPELIAVDYADAAVAMVTQRRQPATRSRQATR